MEVPVRHTDMEEIVERSLALLEELPDDVLEYFEDDTFSRSIAKQASIQELVLMHLQKRKPAYSASWRIRRGTEGELK